MLSQHTRARAGYAVSDQLQHSSDTARRVCTAPTPVLHAVTASASKTARCVCTAPAQHAMPPTLHAVSAQLQHCTHCLRIQHTARRDIDGKASNAARCVCTAPTLLAATAQHSHGASSIPRQERPSAGHTSHSCYAWRAACARSRLPPDEVPTVARAAAAAPSAPPAHGAAYGFTRTASAATGAERGLRQVTRAGSAATAALSAGSHAPSHGRAPCGAARSPTPSPAAGAT